MLPSVYWWVHYEVHIIPRHFDCWRRPKATVSSQWNHQEVVDNCRIPSGFTLFSSDPVVFPCFTETSQWPCWHSDEVHTPLHPLHQTQWNKEVSGLGGEQVWMSSVWGAAVLMVKRSHKNSSFVIVQLTNRSTFSKPSEMKSGMTSSKLWR